MLGKKLTKADFNKFSKLIGADKSSESFKRDWSIVNYVRYTTPDVCVCCCDDYDIRDRTHIEAKTGRYHFEIHHMISVGQNKELDDVDNLAKICPACHASLGRGSADETTQKKLIIKIYTPWVMLLYTFISCIQYLIKCVLLPLAIFYTELKLQYRIVKTVELI